MKLEQTLLLRMLRRGSVLQLLGLLTMLGANYFHLHLVGQKKCLSSLCLSSLWPEVKWQLHFSSINSFNSFKLKEIQGAFFDLSCTHSRQIIQTGTTGEERHNPVQPDKLKSSDTTPPASFTPGIEHSIRVCALWPPSCKECQDWQAKPPPLKFCCNWNRD